VHDREVGNIYDSRLGAICQIELWSEYPRCISILPTRPLAFRPQMACSIQGLRPAGTTGPSNWVCQMAGSSLPRSIWKIVYSKSYDITRDNDALGVMRTRIQSAQHNININQIVSSPSVNSTGHSKAQLIGNSRTTIRAPMMVAGRDERTYGAGSSSPGPSSQNIAERADIQSSPRMIPVSLGVKCRSRYESEWTGSIADIAAEAIE
jgi:hypothetical protein